VKVLVLGIDALDCELLQKFVDDLPNFSRLRRQAKQLKVVSTFPPDSDTAWATIATGLNPAQHGIVRFVDPLEKSYQIINQSIDNAILRGKTFWEIAAMHGYQSYAIFPHLGYPIKDGPGAVVVRGSNVADVQSRPEDLVSDYPDSSLLMGVRGLPNRGMRGMIEYADQLTRLAITDAEFALQILKKRTWDLFFVYWSTIDAIGHFFWRYFDPADPGFEEENPLQSVIPDTYQLFDRIVGKFLDEIDDDVALIVMSDHGHGTRPYKLVNVNEILRQDGYLLGNDLSKKPHLSFYEKTKRYGVSIVTRHGLGKHAGKVLRNFPGLVQKYTRPASINWKETAAYASDMSGIKSYSYGGIIINRSALDGRDYETIRDEIIDLIKQKCVSTDGESLIRFVAHREDIYCGPYIHKYPDILLELKYGYGLGWDVNLPLMTDAYTHNLVPGSHRGDTGTFFIRCNQTVKGDKVDLLQINPTVLDLFNIIEDGARRDLSLFRAMEC
jgi:predicted AlkP superfamily phosphohydrolase/phosphomutase